MGRKTNEIISYSSQPTVVIINPYKSPLAFITHAKALSGDYVIKTELLNVNTMVLFRFFYRHFLTEIRNL